MKNSKQNAHSVLFASSVGIWTVVRLNILAFKKHLNLFDRFKLSIAIFCPF